MIRYPTVVGSVLRKDVLSLYPLLLLVVAVQVLDVLVARLDILPMLAQFMPYLLLLAGATMIFSVFQLDAPASLTDDWLCRPVPKRALLTAKLILVVAVLYGSRVLATMAADLYLGHFVTESLLDAFLLQHPFVMLVLPLLVLVAIVTSSVVQGIGVLLGLFVLVFVVPTPLLRPPGPLEPGIGEALNYNGMAWMAFAPAKVVQLLLLLPGFWLVYQRRSIVQGRILLVGAAALTLLMVALPMWLLPWESVKSWQRSVAAPEAEGFQSAQSRLFLRHASACFPATDMNTLTSDTTYSSTRQLLGVAPWSAEYLEKAGSDGLTFITTVKPIGVPREWRAHFVNVQASYVDAVTGEKVGLRPARYMPERNAGASFSHQWLLPQPELQRLSQGDPSLELTYSLSLLQPRPHEIIPDGRRRRLPGLGWCSASRDGRNNRIDVDCFVAGKRPALLSAELLDISASRIDSHPADYAPALVQAVSGGHYKLQVAMPSLLEKPVIELKAWNVAGFIDATVTSKGILGDDDASCPLPTSQQGTQFSSWRDDSPHSTRYISVDDGVQLEVLDWGGAGTPLLLLPGLGATAHTFDDIAPLLARDYRVFALSRRGIGGSSKPESGYQTPTLARDSIRVLDAMQIEKAVIVGSSIAGEEMSWLGAEYPDRIAGLIYLDAAYDRTHPALKESERDDVLLPPAPPWRSEDLRSYDAMLKWLERTGAAPIPQGELLALYNIGNRYLAGTRAVDMRLMQAVEAGLRRPRYEALQVPVLALFATPDGPGYYMRPWYDPSDEVLMAAVAGRYERVSTLQREMREEFQQLVPHAEIVVVEGASHAIHYSHREEVLAQIRRFVGERVRGHCSLQC